MCRSISSSLEILIVLSIFFTTSGKVVGQEAHVEKAIGVETVQAAIGEVANSLQVPNRFAVIIGANDYIDDRIPDLPACENDAVGLYETLVDPLVGMFPKEHVTLLVGNQVTENAVIDALDFLGRRAGKEDLVFIFFSGHGAVDKSGRSYWVMNDTKVDRLRSTGLGENEITSLIDDIRSNRLVTMIDACYSASTTKIGGSKSLVDMNKIYPEFQGQGRVALTASAGDQLSVVIPEGQLGYGYSAFAYHIIQGLKGKADGAGSGNQEGVITVDELWSYVKDRTESSARLAGGNQLPQLIGQIGSQFMLTIDSKQLIRTNKVVKKRLKYLKGLFIEEYITNVQYEMATRVIQLPGSQLGEYDLERQKIAEDLADGKLDPKYFTSAMKQVHQEQSPLISPHIGVESTVAAPKAPERVVPAELKVLSNKVMIWENRMRMTRLIHAQSNYEELSDDMGRGNGYSDVQSLISQGKYEQASQRATGYSSRFQRTAISGARQWWRRSMEKFGEMPSDFEVSSAFWFGLASEIDDQSILAKTLAIEGVAAIDDFDANGFNALHYAAWLNKTKSVSFLLNQGLDPDLQVEQGGMTALMLAAENGAIDTIELLIDSGSDIDFQLSSQKNHTALFFAVMKNHDQAALKLVRLGANVLGTDSQGATVLHYAAGLGSVEFIQILSGLGSQTDSTDLGGNTPLHTAVEQGSSNVIRLLINLGSEPDAKNRDGVTPLASAVLSGQIECVSQFNLGEVDTQVPLGPYKSMLHYAISSSSVDMLEEIISLGANIEFSDERGQTALHFAAKMSNFDAVKVLLLNEAILDATDAQGRTALHLATKGAEQGGLCVHELIEWGASLNLQDNDGNTPLHLAAFYGFGPHDPEQGVVALMELIRVDADIQVKNAKGRKAFERLKHSKRVDSVSREKMKLLHEAESND